jgi:EAL domain-containing protein (putative c-di-GMP-specific phosphodiesterase class I)
VTFLDQCGCDELQGFYFSHPLPAEELASLLQEHDISPTDRSTDQSLSA